MAAGVTRDLGPCDPIWGGVSLGETQSVKFMHKDDVAEVKTAKGGTAPVDKVYVGSQVKIEVLLTRSQIGQLTAMLPGATGSGTSGDTMVVKSAVGIKQSDNLKTLILKPIIGKAVSINDDEWVTVFRCAPEPDMEWVYDAQTQRVAKVTFTAFPVEQAGSPAGTQVGYLWKVG